MSKAKLPRRRTRNTVQFRTVRTLPTPPRDLLDQLTGHDSVWWVARVQAHVKKASGRKRKDGHSRTNTAKWAALLYQDVVGTFPVGQPFDGNMRLALVTSLVLFTWYARLHRAKVFDPARPLVIRREVYAQWMRNCMEFQRIALDDRNDAAHFPGQKWNNPHLPGARGGKFI